MATNTYDSKSVTIVCGGNIVTGIAPDTFVTVARQNPMWSLVVGADGKSARAKSNDYSGTITITLLQTSPSNDVLSALYAADELTNQGIFPFLLRDGSGRTIVSALTTWIPQLPDVEFAGTVSMRTWVLMTDAVNVTIGGNG